MTIDLKDVTRWTWDQNIRVHCGVDNEFIKRTSGPLKPSIGDDPSIPLDLNWGLMFLPQSWSP